MRKILVAMTLVLGLTMGACSDDDGGDVCTQAYNKGKACADALPDCTTITDATKKAYCDALKAAYSISMADAKAACEKATPGQCDCSGTRETQAAAYNAADRKSVV